MYFLRRKLYSSVTTASFHLPFPLATFISSTKNPNNFISPNPIFKSLPIFSHLKSPCARVVGKEDYTNAVRLQIAITTAAQNDTVARLMSTLNVGQKSIKEERCEDAKFSRDHSGAGLVGWWAGVSEDCKDPYGQIIYISPEHGRFLAKSYSPWQLATSKEGTPLFEIYFATSEVGKRKEQAIYLNYKADAQDGKGVGPLQDMIRMQVYLPELETEKDIWTWMFKNIVAANPETAMNPLIQKLCSDFQIDLEPTKNAMNSGSGDIDGKDQAVICNIEFALGRFEEENAKKLVKELLRVPAELDRKGCFSFCLTVGEDQDRQFDHNTCEGYRTEDHLTFENIESICTGKSKKLEDPHNLLLALCIKAQNQQPVLSGSTTFNKINVTVSSDPLVGLYTASNGHLVTEVIQFRRKFGQWQENGEIKDPSEIESYDYVEAVKLTGDPDVPAGQVAFRAKVGEKYKLPPGSLLEKKIGAVARYKGRGRLTGFQKSRWVDVDVLILGEKFRKDGFALGLLYSASKYQVLKLLKQLSLPSFENSH
ncbi:Protein EXECUTER 1, chloroplastic [Heracleum sosnowskyi]|uniref:Protein EXECUTER 1, chloroplastic n=1 Tax=Heracleum sosnowskyi TaxID=360622 RepID=A0AAD8N593_9APIA|nr:Protein EXECUTER 1, chloroplastic [Heracleum sosnowskyi]